MRASFFKKADLLILVAVLLAALLLALPLIGRERAGRAEIRYRGELLDTVRLTETGEKTYALPEGEVTVRFSPDGVSVLSSPCPGQDCVRTGWIRNEGEGIFCLPLGFSVVLSGEGAHDAITG